MVKAVKKSLQNRIPVERAGSRRLRRLLRKKSALAVRGRWRSLREERNKKTARVPGFGAQSRRQQGGEQFRASDVWNVMGGDGVVRYTECMVW